MGGYKTSEVEVIQSESESDRDGGSGEWASQTAAVHACDTFFLLVAAHHPETHRSHMTNRAIT